MNDPIVAVEGERGPPPPPWSPHFKRGFFVGVFVHVVSAVLIWIVASLGDVKGDAAIGMGLFVLLPWPGIQCLLLAAVYGAVARARRGKPPPGFGAGLTRSLWVAFLIYGGCWMGI